MAVTPTGIISGHLDAGADLVAASAAFQAWIGAANEAAAKAEVLQVAANGGDAERPFAWVRWGQMVVRRGGYATGVLEVVFEEDVGEEYEQSQDEPQGPDPTSAYFAFSNTVGAIVAEMFVASEEPGRLVVQENGIRMTVGPMRAERSEGQDYMMAVFAIEFGGR